MNLLHILYSLKDKEDCTSNHLNKFLKAVRLTFQFKIISIFNYVEYYIFYVYSIEFLNLSICFFYCKRYNFYIQFIGYI